MTTKPFESLTVEQVESFNQFIYVLRRLGVIGKLHTTVLGASGNPFHNFNDMRTYQISYDGYSEDKTEIKLEIELEKIFGKRAYHFLNSF
jgi:hypothetical protein